MTIQTNTKTLTRALDKLDERVANFAYNYSRGELEAIANNPNHPDRILAVLALGEGE